MNIIIYSDISGPASVYNIQCSNITRPYSRKRITINLVLTHIIYLAWIIFTDIQILILRAYITVTEAALFTVRYTITL